MSHHRRRRLLVDGPLQTALMARVAGYWLAFVVATILMQVCRVIVSSAPASSAELATIVFEQSGSAVLASSLLLPVVMIDLLRLSNRFAGPVFRIRRALHDLAEGNPVGYQAFRKGDYWSRLAVDFNRVLDRVKTAEQPIEQE